MVAQPFEQRAFGYFRAVHDVVEEALEEEAEFFRRGLVLHDAEPIAGRASEPPVRLPATAGSVGLRTQAAWLTPRLPAPAFPRPSAASRRERPRGSPHRPRAATA